MLEFVPVGKTVRTLIDPCADGFAKHFRSLRAANFCSNWESDLICVGAPKAIVAKCDFSLLPKAVQSYRIRRALDEYSHSSIWQSLFAN